MRLPARSRLTRGDPNVRRAHRPDSSAAIWVTDTQDGTVRRIDPRAVRVTATIRVGAAPYGIAADSRGLWVTVLGDSAVARVDPVTARVVQRIHTGGDPIAIASDGHDLWVALNSDKTLLRLSPRTH
jgi:YVTN family beta-propeller protein